MQFRDKIGADRRSAGVEVLNDKRYLDRPQHPVKVAVDVPFAQGEQAWHGHPDRAGAKFLQTAADSAAWCAEGKLACPITAIRPSACLTARIPARTVRLRSTYKTRWHRQANTPRRRPRRTPKSMRSRKLGQSICSSAVNGVGMTGTMPSMRNGFRTVMMELRSPVYSGSEPAARRIMEKPPYDR